MEWIDKINTKNFNISFDLKSILTNSVYYPASATDGKPIEGLSRFSFSFIYADYSLQKEQVENALKTEFELIGYRLVGMRYVSDNELIPNGITPQRFPLNESEKERMHYRQESIRNLDPFALWAVYELDSELIKKNSEKISRFSILYIGGEACTTFDKLYVYNKINPLAVAILNSGEGCGDNWTHFNDPDYRFYKMIEYNALNNYQAYPKYLFTNMCSEISSFWPNYKLKKRNHRLECYLYENF